MEANKVILTKAISKAIDGGWFVVANLCGFIVWTPISILDTLIVLEDKDNHEKRQYNYQAVIFNHDFAKVLWGEEERVEPNSLPKDQRPGRFTGGGLSGSPFEVITKMGWQRHLQAMVIADDPIKYLGEHLND